MSKRKMKKIISLCIGAGTLILALIGAFSPNTFDKIATILNGTIVDNSTTLNNATVLNSNRTNQ